MEYIPFVRIVNRAGVSILDCFEFKLDGGSKIEKCAVCGKTFGWGASESRYYQHYIDKHLGGRR